MNRWLLVLALSVPVLAGLQGDKSRDATLVVAGQLFGARVSTPELFEVDRFRVLRLQFSSSGRLTEAAVEPKFFFRDIRPDWEEPKEFDDMTAEEYKSVVARLEKLCPKGALKTPAPASSIVTNLLACHTEEYEHATLTWAEVVDLRRGDRAPLRVRYVTVVAR